MRGFLTVCVRWWVRRSCGLRIFLGARFIVCSCVKINATGHRNYYWSRIAIIYISENYHNAFLLVAVFIYGLKTHYLVA